MNNIVDILEKSIIGIEFITEKKNTIHDENISNFIKKYSQVASDSAIIFFYDESLPSGYITDFCDTLISNFSKGNTPYFIFLKFDVKLLQENSGNTVMKFFADDSISELLKDCPRLNKDCIFKDYPSQSDYYLVGREEYEYDKKEYEENK